MTNSILSYLIKKMKTSHLIVLMSNSWFQLTTGQWSIGMNAYCYQCYKDLFHWKVLPSISQLTFDILRYFPFPVSNKQIVFMCHMTDGYSNESISYESSKKNCHITKGRNKLIYLWQNSEFHNIRTSLHFQSIQFYSICIVDGSTLFCFD